MLVTALATDPIGRASLANAISRDIMRVVVDDIDSGARLRARRLEAGMTQRALAGASGIPQPNIAAYETGRRTPTGATLRRLDGALNAPTLDRARAARDRLVAAAAAQGLTDLRVFGSVARGDASSRSDVDLLVHPGAEASLFDLAAFMNEAEEILGVRVDVVSDGSTGDVAEAIKAEAIPL